MEWSGYNLAAVEATNDPDVALDSDNEVSYADELADQSASFHTQRWHVLHPRERIMTKDFHFPEKMDYEPTGEYTYIEGRIKNKKTNPRQRCKACPNQTRYKCQQCNVYLCIKDSSGRDCFSKFHTMENFL